MRNLVIFTSLVFASYLSTTVPEELRAQAINESTVVDASADQDGFVSIFDGKSLDDWAGDEPYWRVKDGAIYGKITPETVIERNRFLIYKGTIPNDFELKLEYRISEKGNSGINYRSEVIEGINYYALKGYQFDLDGANDLTGSNYQERMRSTLAKIGEQTELPVPDNPESLEYRVKKPLDH